MALAPRVGGFGGAGIDPPRPCRPRKSCLPALRVLPRQRPDMQQCFVVVDRLQLVLQRFAADRDPLLDHEHDLRRGQRVPLDRVGGVCQLETAMFTSGDIQRDPPGMAIPVEAFSEE